ncbi:hypothetical protein ACFWAZ_39645 [Streptomyces collinus]|uniref:hypothetical protein n=1 Tax=Streptomyces collinus TaxID=42684 RepID=UPI00364F1BF6
MSGHCGRHSIPPENGTSRTAPPPRPHALDTGPLPALALALTGSTGIGGIVLVLIGAPWWLTALAFTCFVLVLVVGVIKSVFPQESGISVSLCGVAGHQPHLTVLPAQPYQPIPGDQAPILGKVVGILRLL